MKNKKLSKLGIAASAAMLLAGCDIDAMREYQRNALQTKLEQMPAAEADAYIRREMDGVQKTHYEKITGTFVSLGDIGYVSTKQKVVDGLYLDLWEKNDTNGTLIDEYVDYAMNTLGVEAETKSDALDEFVLNMVKPQSEEAKQKKKELRAIKTKNELQQKINKLQKQVDDIDQQLSK